MADLGLLFRKGTLASLKDADIVNGSINITTDEPGIYVDFDGARKRIGDFQQFATLAELQAAAVKDTITENALYYVQEGNYLLKWTKTGDDGSKAGEFTWINDTTALRTAIAALEQKDTEFAEEVEGLTDRVTTLEGQVKDIIGGEGESVNGETIKSLKDLTTVVSSMATSGTVEELQTKVAALEAKDKALDEKDGELLAAIEAEAERAQAAEAVNAAAAAGAQAAAEAAQGEVDALEVLVGTKDDTSSATTAFGLIKKNAEAIEANAKAITEGDDAVKAIIGDGYSSENTVAAKITSLEENITTNIANISSQEGRIADLEAAIGENGSVAAEIEALRTEVSQTYQTKDQAEKDHDSIVKQITALETGTVATNTAAIAALNSKVDVEKVSTAIEDAINAVNTEIEAIDGRVDTLESDNATNKTNIAQNTTDIAANKAAIEAEVARMDAFLAVGEGESLNDALDTLKELQDYITSEAAEADQVVARIGNLEAEVGDPATGDADPTGLYKLIADEEAARKAADEALSTRISSLENNTITEDGDTNLVITTDSDGNTKIGMVWGNF